MNPPEHEKPKLSRELRPKPVDDYLKNLEELARRGDNEISPELKVPAQPRSDEEVIALRKRLAAINIPTTDAPEPQVQVANVAVARAGLCHARAGLIERPRGKSVPGLAFVFVHPASKTIDTLVLTLPDDGPALMDIAMGLFWHEVNIVPLGQATLTPGTSAYYAVKNCPMEMLDRGHLKAESNRIEASHNARLKEVERGANQDIRESKAKLVESEKGWTLRYKELENLFAIAEEAVAANARRFKVAIIIAVILLIPAFRGIAEWLR